MRLQDNQANCGAAAVKNGLCALGIDRSTEECELLCGTTANGTPPKRLLKGLQTIHELDPAVFHSRNEIAASAILESFLRKGRPTILLVDNAEHWVTAIGLLGERVLIADGADSELVTSYPTDGFTKRWVNKHSKSQPYYGITL